MSVAFLSASGAQSTKSMTTTLFEGEFYGVALSQAVRVYLSNFRQGTSKVKTRSDINRTKKKWFKQKGTGNARHGARTPNIFVGGGVSHGPNGLQNWRLTLTPRLKRQALLSALRSQQENVIVYESLEKMAAKTAVARQLLTDTKTADQSVVVVCGQSVPDTFLAFRNMPNVLTTTASRITALEVAAADALIMSPESLDILEKRLLSATPAKHNAKTVAAKSEAAKPEVKKAAPKKPAVEKIAKPAAKKAVPKKATPKK
jgi:large subunit ribosomal protein L4